MAGRLRHLEAIFPALMGSDYSRTSDQDPSYNCFAFAVYDTHQWWEKIPVRGYYWPLERDDRLEDWIRALELNNYKTTGNWGLEPGFEKAAIYVNQDGSPEHVARQLESGKWTSKIGKCEDIEHATLEALEGREYGKATVVLKRKRFDPNET